MRKSEILALIKHNKSGGYPDRVNKFDDRVLYKYIDLALQQSVEELLQKDGSLPDSLLKTFYPYLQWDKEARVAFAKLPASILPLRNNGGLHWVSGRYDETSQWIQQSNGAQEVFADLEAGNVDNQTYYLEGKKLIFPKILKTQVGIPIKVKIVCGMNGYSSDDEITIPSTPVRFVDMVLRMLDSQRMTPQKESNDGNVNNPA